MDLKLKNKKVVVTGASMGIGFEIAKCFSNQGSITFINSRNIKNLRKAKKKIKDKNLNIYSGDLTSISDTKKFYDFVKKNTSVIDTLVCNIGYSTPNNLIGEENYDNWIDSIHLNLLSAINSIYYFKKLLKKSKTPSIVCISSICGVDALGAPIDYSVSKAALISFVKNQAKVLARNNIRINSVSPGNIIFKDGNWDHKIKKNKKKVMNYIKDNVPLNKFGTTKNIADIVLFLSSELSSFTTGANMVVDGGQTR